MHNVKTLFSTFVLVALSIVTAQSAAESPDLLLLEQQLEQEEARFADLVPGTEKLIRWHDGQRQKTDTVLLYVHGFSASRQELSPTTELVADKLGANALYLRLTGHGRSDDAMAEGTIEKWQTDLLQGLQHAKLLGNRTVLVSASTGSTLAMWALAAGHTEQIAANVMVSPNFGVKSKAAGIVTWPFGLTVAKWINGDYNSFTPMSEKHGLYWTERYPLEAVVPMLELVDLVADMDKSSITVPQLFIYSANDKVVDVEEIEKTARMLKNAPVKLTQFSVSTDPYQHVLSGDACSPESTGAMVNLIYDYLINKTVE